MKQIAALVFVSLTLVAPLITGCGHQQAAVGMIRIAADDCVQIAKLHGREDVATYCRTADDLAPLLSSLMASHQRVPKSEGAGANRTAGAVAPTDDAATGSATSGKVRPAMSTATGPVRTLTRPTPCPPCDCQQ